MRAKVQMIKNDIIWNFKTDLKTDKGTETFQHQWLGSNDKNWWKLVSETERKAKITGSQGTKLVFKINFKSCDVELVG